MQTIFTELLEASVFSKLKPCQSIEFQNAVTPKVLKFRVVTEEGERALYLTAVISKDEKPMWQSFQELLSHSVKLAAQSMQGIYGLDVLSANIQQGIQHFNIQSFAALLMNHGKQLSYGQKKLIRYGQVFCLLHKRAPADWAKFEISDHVEIVDFEKTRLYTFLKKVFKAGNQDSGAIYLIHDLGRKNVWHLERELQVPKFSDFLREYPIDYVYHTLKE